METTSTYRHAANINGATCVACGYPLNDARCTNADRYVVIAGTSRVWYVKDRLTNDIGAGHTTKRAATVRCAEKNADERAEHADDGAFLEALADGAPDSVMEQF